MSAFAVLGTIFVLSIWLKFNSHRTVSNSPIFYPIMVMMSLNRQFLLPALGFAGSLLAITLLFLLTSPVDKVGYAIVFFVLLLIGLVSLGFLILRFWGGQPNAKNRYRIAVISLFIVIALMFRSAQSFNLIDALIVVLVAFGLLFYGGRRF